MQVVAESRSLTLKESVAQVLRAAQSFAGRPFEDDVSALAIEVEPRASTVEEPHEAGARAATASVGAAVASESA
jgi:hypothetical protein